jgi:hypothetical protein
VAFGAGAAATADAGIQILIACAVIVLLAMAVLLACDPRWKRVTLAFMLWAPWVAGLTAITEALRRTFELGALVTTPENRPPLRGAALSLAVVGVFGLLLSNADPVLATLRDDLVDALTRLDIVPRLAFFLTVLVGALGGGGMILRREPVPGPDTSVPASTFRIGDVERLIVLGSVVALFASFLLLQVSYLFGNAPARVGSGITFAEYARRGFSELTTVATLCTLLLVFLDGWASRGRADRWARLASVAVTAELLLLLCSALRRLWLYEEAYGFTRLRLYAHAYMVVMAALIVLLGWELSRGLRSGRMARRAASIGALALLALIYWNHEAWIVRANVARYARTGQLDALYLQHLSANAVPAIVESLPELPRPIAARLRASLRGRFSSAAKGRWFEWNLRRREAAEALRAAGIVPGAIQVGGDG